MVPPNAALRLRCIRPFQDGDESREAGDEWMFTGPATYVPKVEEQVYITRGFLCVLCFRVETSLQVVELVRATIVKENEALKLRARREFVHPVTKKTLLAGEEWFHKEVCVSPPPPPPLPFSLLFLTLLQSGAYLPGVNEEIVETVKARVLTENKALHMRAVHSFVDQFNRQRKVRIY